MINYFKAIEFLNAYNLLDLVWNKKFLWFCRGKKNCEMRFHKSFGSVLTDQLKSSYIFVGLAVPDINEGSHIIKGNSLWNQKKKNMKFFEITPWGILYRSDSMTLATL